ncbi:protein of unknown function [Bradyrhizobium vignae]|uniref:Uncharacterized protein n=1 Tax=Bradyrhizobium vignae TaxID=1549949 RepID=A0A2U3PZ50_9BRAD|nr:protein of unknown function [Bradyrhizobium vignae]
MTADFSGPPAKPRGNRRQPAWGTTSALSCLPGPVIPRYLASAVCFALPALLNHGVKSILAGKAPLGRRPT